MQQGHFNNRNTILGWNMFRLVMFIGKVLFGLYLFRWEFIYNAFFAMFLTLFFLAAVSSLLFICSLVLYLAEVGSNIAALIYFIVLSTSAQAEKFFWITCLFIALDLIILALLFPPMLKFKSVNGLVKRKYTPPK
jgi:hypothetical protein